MERNKSKFNAIADAIADVLVQTAETIKCLDERIIALEREVKHLRKQNRKLEKKAKIQINI